MSEPPHVTRRKAVEQAAREQRLAKALRENLRRRKEQARAQDRIVDTEPGDGIERREPKPEPPA
jgi:hypothetical protein